MSSPKYGSCSVDFALLGGMVAKYLDVKWPTTQFELERWLGAQPSVMTFICICLALNMVSRSSSSAGWFSVMTLFAFAQC